MRIKEFAQDWGEVVERIHEPGDALQIKAINNSGRGRRSSCVVAAPRECAGATAAGRAVRARRLCGDVAAAEQQRAADAAERCDAAGRGVAASLLRTTRAAAVSTPTPHLALPAVARGTRAAQDDGRGSQRE